MNIIDFYDSLLSKLFDAEDVNLLTVSTYFNENPTSFPEIENFQLPASFLEIYRKVDGMTIEWKATNIEQAYGRMEFLEIRDILSDWQNEFYDSEDLENNEMLNFFKPFDLVSSEIMCGFIITPQKTYESIYLNISGETETVSLRLDLEGYITMLYESRAYKNWPIILLNIEDSDLESPLITEFKSDMPVLFPDFDWDRYIAKYQSLRL